MKNMNVNLAMITVIVLVVAALYYRTRKDVAEGAKAVAAAVNPVSDQNVFYRGISRVEDSLQGDGQKLPYGVRIYDWLHGDKDAELTAPVMMPTRGRGG